MLADAKPQTLLTQAHLLAVLPLSPHTAHTLCLDRDWPAVARRARHDPRHSVSPHNVAYVIYTSGSTGTAKGVAVSHSDLSNGAYRLSGPVDTIADIAATHASALVRLGFDVPLLLVGHSYGGSVAFEMARLLEADGHEVSLLLLDSLLLGWSRSELEGSARHPERQLDSRIACGVEASGLRADGVVGPILGSGVRRRPDEPAFDALDALLQIQTERLRRYRPSGVFGGVAAHIVASDGEIRRSAMDRLSDQSEQLFARAPTLYFVPGDHLSMLTPDHAAHLADVLAQEALKAQSRSRKGMSHPYVTDPDGNRD